MLFSTGYVRPRSNSIGVTRANQDHINTKTNIRPRPATPIRLQRYSADTNYKSVSGSSSAEPNNNNTSSTIISKSTTNSSENNFHHQQQQIQKIQLNNKKIIPPPEVVVDQQQHICELYSDTLDQCFDKTGVYVCKSYGPRCYIIQKVIKNPTMYT